MMKRVYQKATPKEIQKATPKEINNNQNPKNKDEKFTRAQITDEVFVTNARGQIVYRGLMNRFKFLWPDLKNEVLFVWMKNGNYTSVRRINELDAEDFATE